nr:hypothetical protein [Tanacetum cinerariifolium]
MAPKKRTTRSSPVITTTTTTPITDAQLMALIAQGVANVLAERDTTRSRKCEDNHDSGTGELALMCARMFPEESDKIERYVGGFPDMIHGSVMTFKPKIMQDAIKFTTELMDKKISTVAERQDKNKWKLDNNNLPKARFSSQWTLHCKVRKLQESWSLDRDYRSPAATNNQRNLTCYECGNHKHYRSDCPQLKNQNHKNQAGGTRTRGMVHALRRGETNQDLNDMKDDINA